MMPSEAIGIHYFTPENQPSFLNNFEYNTLFMSNLPNYHTSPPPPLQEFTPYFSNNSTSDEADDQQHALISQRKQRRMISNRESARRSRMRKQRQLEELWTHVQMLRSENLNMRDKVTDLSESHDRVLQENTRLKEEASDLRRMLSDLQIGSPYNATINESDELSCNIAHLTAESSNQGEQEQEEPLRENIV